MIAAQRVALEPRLVASGVSILRVRRRLEALVGPCRHAATPSAVEHRPADRVSEPLIIQDEFANRSGELFALPTALGPLGALTCASGVAARAALIASSQHRACVRSGSAQRACRASLRHRDLASSMPASARSPGRAAGCTDAKWCRMCAAHAAAHIAKSRWSASVSVRRRRMVVKRARSLGRITVALVLLHLPNAACPVRYGRTPTIDE